MRIVDAHTHASRTWFEPVELLIHQMDLNGVERAVLVQIQAQIDNEYQLVCVERFPDRLLSVVWVDPVSPDAPAELARLKERGARGVRLRATSRSPGPDSLAIWRAAAELGMPVSCNGSLAEHASDEFAALVRELPGLPIVIEHLGASTARDRGMDAPPYEARRRAFALARFPNIYMKIHGLGEFAQRAPTRGEQFPFVEPIPPLLEMAYEAFGPGRLMWGSNYPPVSQQEGYANALHLTMARFADRPEAEQALVFGGTAAAVYGQ